MNFREIKPTNGLVILRDHFSGLQEGCWEEGPDFARISGLYKSLGLLQVKGLSVVQGQHSTLVLGLVT